MTEDKKKEVKAFEGLANALAKYIAAMGGKAVVVGGVSIEQSIGARKFNYVVRISVTGKVPTKRNV